MLRHGPEVHRYNNPFKQSLIYGLISRKQANKEQMNPAGLSCSGKKGKGPPQVRHGPTCVGEGAHSDTQIPKQKQNKILKRLKKEII